MMTATEDKMPEFHEINAFCLPFSFGRCIDLWYIDARKSVLDENDV